jgi:hypothetical protein
MGEPMILTCHACPRQISCCGKATAMFVVALQFGWRLRESGGGFLCSGCGASS